MPSESSRILQAFGGGLEALGYTEGQNIAIERRYGDSKGKQLRELATELINLKVDVIVAWNTPVALGYATGNEHNPHRRGGYGRSG